MSTAHEMKSFTMGEEVPRPTKQDEQDEDARELQQLGYRQQLNVRVMWLVACCPLY